MILLDPRIGSGELLPYFQPYGVEVEVQHLDYGDCCWWGQGHDGPVLVSAERKIITDLIASMRSNRLSGHQLPGLLDTYAFTYILIEGNWRSGEGGAIEIPTRGGWIPLRVGSRSVLFREVDHYLATLDHRVGLSILHSSNKEQTVAQIVSRYHWWQKDWYKHDSFEAIYAPYETARQSRRGTFVQRKVGAVELVASQFPGVSKKAFGFGKVFGSVQELVNAKIEELEKVEGIGKKGAKAIHAWLRGVG